MKKFAILGSTGSIGTNSLKVIDHLEGEVVALAAHSNIDLLESQARKFSPQLLAVYDHGRALELQKRLPKIPVLAGEEGVLAVATHPDSEMVISSMSGFDGVKPTLEAIRAKKQIALANKEALVAAGPIVVDLAKKNGVALIPIDSEHTAIFQCLKGEKIREVHKIILTASGGPFREYDSHQLSSITLDEALEHPNYNMGPKVTVDSSTMMNKGLEMIEAHFFYDIPVERIDVVIHPEQIIHSMVEFIDGSIMAQMGYPDMIVPIQVALSHPERKEALAPHFDFSKNLTINFSSWDADRFRCLDLAYQSLKDGGSMPCFMNAANEALVSRFLKGQISWIQIGQKLETLMATHQTQELKHYQQLAFIDNEARELALRI